MNLYVITLMQCENTNATCIQQKPLLLAGDETFDANNNLERANKIYSDEI